MIFRYVPFLRASFTCLIISSCLFQAHEQYYIYLIAPCWGDLFTNRDALNRDDAYNSIFTVLDTYKKNDIIVRQVTPQMLSPDTLKTPYTVIWFDLFPNYEQYFTKIPKAKQILFIWEPPCVCPTSHNVHLHQYFSKVFTWNDDLLHSASSATEYKKLFYPHLRKPIIVPKPFSSKKLLTLINSNLSSSISGELYSERQKIIKFCEKNCSNDFDLYGRGWNKDNWPSYQGPIDRKENVLNKYKFCLCFENCQISGYITEKIFDCFYSRCVPVYLGAPNLSEYIPSDCYIDMSSFRNYEELLLFLKQMNEATYIKYIEAAEKFCLSKEAQCFASTPFIKTMLSVPSHIKINNP